MNQLDKSFKKYLIIFWVAFSLPFVIMVLIFTLIATGNMGFMPSFKDLENPRNNLASEIISEDNVILGRVYYQNRSTIDFEDLSPNVVKAIVSIEDIRFEKHSGIDARGLSRVFFKTLLMGQGAGGGSTITQQLAKNLFGRDTTQYNSKFKRKLNLGITKFKEWVTAIRLEKNYTKREILVMYLNTVFFGSSSYGIKSAARTYFNTTPDSLKIEDAALLAGVINAPTKYNPVTNTERAKLRRNVVLEQMMKYGYISEKEFDSLIILPIKLKYRESNENQGLAPYFREYLRITLTAKKPKRKDYYALEDFKRDSMEWLNNPLYGWIFKNRKPDGSIYDLYVDGLKIYTTINSKIQKYAEESVNDHIGKYLQKEFFLEKKGRYYAPFSSELSPDQVKQIMRHAIVRTRRYHSLKSAGMSEDSINIIFKKKVKMRIFTWAGEKDTLLSPYDSIKYYKHLIRTGFVAIDPHTGYIKAYIGGINFKYFKYDHVTMGRRQVGSTIKPFLYTLAMQEGYSPCYKVPNVPQTFQMGDTTWTPKNSDISGKEGEMVTLKWGMANSVNYISAWLVKQFTPGAVIDIMKKMGVTSNLMAVPSVILGTPEISLIEMTSAYSTFANKGVYTIPTCVTKIEDKAGNVITKFYPQKKEAISDQTAYLMVTLMESVVKEGTGVRLRYKYNLMNQLGGKTGTTQNQSDGWYIGIAPNLVAGVWVGGEDRASHFDGIYLGQGANTALPIYAYFMKKIYADTSLSVSSNDVFEIPTNYDHSINCKDISESEIKDIFKTNEEEY